MKDNMTPNLKIIAIQFLTPFISTSAYGGTHRPIDRIVLRQRKLVDGRPSAEWEKPPEFRGWTARIEGPSVFVRPAQSNSEAQEPVEIEIPRACVAITWDREEEIAAIAAKVKAAEDDKTKKGT